MKIKKIIYKTTLLFFFLSSYLLSGQIIRKMDPDEYLLKDNFRDLYSGTNSDNNVETETGDFSFNWGNGFNTAFNNLVLLDAARKEREYRNWYARQQNLIKEEIEKKLDKEFGSFDDAKNEYFAHIEMNNTNRNRPPIRSKYNSKYRTGRSKEENYLRELKSLQLREVEIRAGNIDNPQFPFIEVNDIPLKDFKSLNDISQYRNRTEIAFGDNTWEKDEYRDIRDRLDNLGSDFDNEVLSLKHSFYNDFSEWERLGLMQLLLNYEQYKESISCMICILPDELTKFRGSDMATPKFIEDYARKNKMASSISIFDPRYIDVYPYKYQNNLCGGAINYAEWERDKKEALYNMVRNTSTPNYAALNLIGELGIEDSNQKNWLLNSENSNNVSAIITFLNNNRVNGILSAEANNFAKLATDTWLDNSEFILNNFNSYSQFIPDYEARMSQQELQIFNNQSLGIKNRYLYNAYIASEKAKELFPGSQRNTKADAFRHSYFHSLNTYFIGYNLSVQLGDAHEIDTPAHLELEKVMDLYNNEVGRQKARNPSIRFNAVGTLFVRLSDAISSGDLVHLSPLNSDSTINSNTLLVPTN